MQFSANLNVMIKAARAAGRSLVKDFREVENLQVSVKAAGDFVSRADIAAEKIVRDILVEARPNYGWLGEESEPVEGKDPTRRWIVDPLDGTTNFLHGLPHWAISIALEQHGEITAGMVFDPLRNELFTAERGSGAYLNDRRIRVSRRGDMRLALIGCGLPIQNWKGRELGFTRQMDRVADECGGLRRLGVASLDLAYVAAGRQDGYWEHGCKPWDIAAGLLMVREAGGRVGRLEGDEEIMAEGTIVAGNPEIYEKLRATLLEVTPVTRAADQT
jgi:myo-inositol-1(or 4)-monophosphatase